MLILFAMALSMRPGAASGPGLRMRLGDALRREDEFMAGHLRDQGWTVEAPEFPQ